MLQHGPMPLLALIAAAALALVHLLAGKLRFLEGIPRSRWLSAAGGGSGERAGQAPRRSRPPARRVLLLLLALVVALLVAPRYFRP